jgi:exosome complex component RRP43
LSIPSCGLVNLEDLCIVKGQCVWMLQVDVVCLCHDGNVTDAALVALVAALRNLRLPKPTVLEDGEVVVHPTETSPLALGPIPVALTCVVALDHILADPTDLEEDLASSAVTVVLAGPSHKVRRCPHTYTHILFHGLGYPFIRGCAVYSLQ